MDLSTFIFGAALTVLPLIAAGLLAAMVAMERRAERLAVATGPAGHVQGRHHARHRKAADRRRRA